MEGAFTAWRFSYKLEFYKTQSESFSHSHQISVWLNIMLTTRCINTADILVQTVHIHVRSPTIDMLQASSIPVGYSWGGELLYKDVAKNLV